MDIKAIAVAKSYTDKIVSETGLKGKDGVSITKTEINNKGELIITLSDGTVSNLGVVVGAKGDKGDTGATGATGEKGDKGEQGVSGVYVGSGDMPEGYNVQIDPDGEALEVVTKEEFQQFSETIENNMCGENVAGKIQTDTNGNQYIGETNAECFNGNINIAKGAYSHAEGYQTKALGNYSHAEGSNTISGDYEDLVENVYYTGKYTHAEGDGSVAAGDAAHAEGRTAKALNIAAHAEGRGTIASGQTAHAEGHSTIASANYTHAEGYTTIAVGWASHSEGSGTKAIANSQHVQGKWNIPENHIHIVGYGTGEDDATAGTYRANIHHLTTAGEGWFAKGTSTTNADYAEYYEWLDGNVYNEDRIGLLVTLDGEKIKLANFGDEILGIISGTAAVIGDDPASSWKRKYLTDDFGRIIYEDREDFEEIIVEKINEETGEIYEETEIVSLGFSKYPILNPEYDPTQEYIPRSERPEWDIVGLLGKLYVRDDGTATVNGYATVRENGIATTSLNKTNMRVLSRVKDNIIKVQKQ